MRLWRRLSTAIKDALSLNICLTADFDCWLRHPPLVRFPVYSIWKAAWDWLWDCFWCLLPMEREADCTLFLCHFAFHLPISSFFSLLLMLSFLSWGKGEAKWMSGFIQIQWTVLNGFRLSENAATQGKFWTGMACGLLPRDSVSWGWKKTV